VHSLKSCLFGVLLTVASVSRWCLTVVCLFKSWFNLELKHTKGAGLAGEARRVVPGEGHWRGQDLAKSAPDAAQPGALWARGAQHAPQRREAAQRGARLVDEQRRLRRSGWRQAGRARRRAPAALAGRPLRRPRRRPARAAQPRRALPHAPRRGELQPSPSPSRFLLCFVFSLSISAKIRQYI